MPENTNGPPDCWRTCLTITGGTGPWKPADAMESVEVLRIDDGEQFATVHLPFIERLI